MPRGFAHHTSTPSQGPAGRGVEEPSDVLRDTSVTLALTIITEQYELVYEKAMLCALGSAGLCTKDSCELGSRVSILARQDEELRRSLPLGFLQAQLGTPAGDRDAWLRAMRSTLQRLFSKIEVDTTQAPLAGGVRQIVEVLWDSVGSMARSSLLESTFAPLIGAPGLCSDPRCVRRKGVPLANRTEMQHRISNFLLSPYFKACRLNEINARYAQGTRAAGGLIERI